jgi:hypothetical protein
MVTVRSAQVMVMVQRVQVPAPVELVLVRLKA